MGGFALSGAAPLKCTTSLDFFGGWLDDVFETVFAGGCQRAVEAGRGAGGSRGGPSESLRLRGCGVGGGLPSRMA